MEGEGLLRGLVWQMKIEITIYSLCLQLMVVNNRKNVTHCFEFHQREREIGFAYLETNLNNMLSGCVVNSVFIVGGCQLWINSSYMIGWSWNILWLCLCQQPIFSKYGLVLTKIAKWTHGIKIVCSFLMHGVDH